MNRIQFLTQLANAIGLAALAPKELVNKPQKPQQQYNEVLRFYVRGFKYYKGPELIKDLIPGTLLTLVREPNNKYDKDAIAVTFGNNKLGFVPYENNQVLARLIDAQAVTLCTKVSKCNIDAPSYAQLEVVVYSVKDVAL